MADSDLTTSALDGGEYEVVVNEAEAQTENEAEAAAAASPTAAAALTELESESVPLPLPTSYPTAFKPTAAADAQLPSIPSAYTEGIPTLSTATTTSTPKGSKGVSFGITPVRSTYPSGGITLKAIGFTCAGGMVVSLLTLLWFGLAVKRRNVGVAPRCTARHPNVIYNPNAGKGKMGRRVARRRARAEGRWVGWRIGRWLLGGLGWGEGDNVEDGRTGGDRNRVSKAKLARAEARAGNKGMGAADKDGSGGKNTATNKSGTGNRSVLKNLVKRKNASGGKTSDNNSQPVMIHTSSEESDGGGGNAITDANTSTPTRTNRRKHHKRQESDTSSMPSSIKYGRGPDKYTPAPSSTKKRKGGSSEDDSDHMKFHINDYDAADNSLIGPEAAHNDYNDINDVAVQWRGNPFTGWIPWSLSLSYDTMLRGVPGTGTRRRGLDGSMLRVNLDAIVLFRFHAICLRVAVLATILCIGIVLPLNLTARCHNIIDDPTDPDYDVQCFSANYTLTDYERTTLKNIPPLTYADADDPTKNLSADAGFVERLVAAFKHSAANTIWGSAYMRNLGRLYGIVLCSWIITWYAIHVIGREWIDALALRRVYYLENDHWDDRKDELSQTLLRDDSDSDSDEDLTDDDGGRDGKCGCSKNNADPEEAARAAQRRRRKRNRAGAGGGGTMAAGHLASGGNHARRDPWIPHPEQRDTVPNVELYSVLVGGLPSLPSEVVDEQDIEAAVGYSRRQSIDWQLAVATSFFDHCVPNQPGFSSSIAAITILPDAPELAQAWRKWYVAAAALRRLRFIRTLIADLRHYDVDDFSDGESDEQSFENDSSRYKESIEMKLADMPNQGARINAPSNLALPPAQRRVGGVGGAGMGATNNLDTVGVDISYKAAAWNNGDTSFDGTPPDDDADDEAKAIYLDMQRRMKYYRDVFGSSDNEDVEALLFQALNYGPEQSAVYSREMAQGAAACCPNGCGEERLRRASIDELLILERDAIAAVHDANLNLQYAQARAAVSVLDTDDPKMHLPQKGHREDMEKHLEEDKNFVPLRSTFDLDSNTARDSTANVSEMPDSPSHHKSNSFDDLSLPEALQMEGQLLAKYRQGKPAGISRHSSAPVNSMVLTPTTDNRKTVSKEEGIETSLNLLQSYLPTIKESVKSRETPSTASEGVSQHSHLSAVYVSKDPNHPLMRNDRSSPSKSTSASTQNSYNSHTTNGGIKNIYSHIPHGPSGNKAMALSADGKFYLRGSPRGSPPSVLGGGGGSFDRSTSTNGARRSLMSPRGEPRTGNLLDLPPSTAGNASTTGEWPPMTDSGFSSGLSRRRLNTDTSISMRSTSSRQRGYQEPSVQWAAVERIISDDATNRDRESLDNSERYAVRHKHKPTTGVWEMPTASSIVTSVWEGFIGMFKSIWSYAKRNTNAVVDELARESTFAVVTFTSRQAAVAARHCIADGRGQSRWLTVGEVPVPPLADAAACDFITCRGCCRPVSLSIPKKQQMLRRYSSYILLATIYMFYTFPISAAAAFADPSKLYPLWPELEEIVNSSVIFKQILAGLVPALLFTLFFALCPVMFKSIANFGSNATSVAVAEKYALSYYWWFMVCTAFSGSSLMTMVLNAANEGQVANSVTEVLIEIAGTIPTQVSSTWINWIIVRTTMTLPLQYMLQLNTHLFKWIGWKCCARCVIGGGPGGPIPYRIYIDSGVVFLCIVSLAPASPLVAPISLLYFLYCAPLWRRNCLFVYRPKFDSGGSRWPFLADVFLWSMFVGQILLTTMMALKEAVGPAILAALPIIPTLYFRKMSRHRFLKSYMDAGLLQTSLLDGWDNGVPTSTEKREEFRQFLVDSHKAAYIPICIAGGATTVLTCEPAHVTPHEADALTLNLPPMKDINL